jgi:nucleotide-binding universal stress UspA family protein
MIQLNKILYPTDFSDLSLFALRYARNFAKAFSAELHVLHVVDEAYQNWVTMGPNTIPVGPTAQEMLDLAREQMAAFMSEHLGDGQSGFTVVSKVMLGRPYPTILDYASQQQIDMIVIATHGRGALTHMLLGSVTEKVVRKAPCPVLTVRHPEHEFVTPAEEEKPAQQ